VGVVIKEREQHQDQALQGVEEIIVESLESTANETVYEEELRGIKKTVFMQQAVRLGRIYAEKEGGRYGEPLEVNTGSHRVEG
jgi:hypothetical protein